MSNRKVDAVELVRRILRFDDDLLDPDCSEARIDEELCAAGLDPDEVGAEGEAFVAKLLAERAPPARRSASTTRLRVPTTAASSPPFEPAEASDDRSVDEPE